MWFLFFQIWVWLIVAFALGWFAHWFFCCRGEKEAANDKESPDVMPLATEVSTTAIAEIETDSEAIGVDEDWKPALFAVAPEKIDDLKQIKGVGQVLETTLHDLGVYQFDQIAQWSDEHVAWMDNFLSFTGRIDREDWRGQAKTLASGGSTEFARKVEDGDVEY